jgi:dipeptidyl aminopeptidase/acylaminoacyl peptidase
MKIFLITLSLFLLHCAGWSQTKRALRPDDIYRLQNISDPQVSTEGNWVAYVLSSVDTAKDKRNSDIWMVSWDGKQNVQLTNSPAGESSPRFSPDGKYLSFLSSRKVEGGKEDKNPVSQIWLMDRRGGEGKKLTEIKSEIEDYTWSPDGKKLLLVMKDADFSDTSKDKARDPFVMDRYHFKQDIQGYLSNRRNHLYLLTVDTKKIDTLTSGMYNETSPVFSPDGSQIAFVSNRTAEPDKNENTSIWLMDAKQNATPQQLTDFAGSESEPAFSPDGRRLAYLQSSSAENFTMYGENYLATISRDGGKPTIISGAIDRPVRNAKWTKDGKFITVLMEDDRQCYPVQFSVTDAKMTKLAGGDKSFSDLVYNKTLDKWLVAMSEPMIPTELYALENGASRKLTSVSDSFLAPLKLNTVEGFKSTSKDGTIISGLLYRPVQTTKKLPLILFIHGGPVAQDEFEFDFYRQVLAAGGYAVAGVNYRGSSGRGIDFTKSIYADWGNKEVQDIIGAADYLIEKGIADSARMGIGGWSYGGILTDYTIATDSRFKAAASGAGSALQLSMYGVDQYVTQYETELGAPWKNVDKWIKLSYPFFHVDRIKTPTLFMASQQDFNVPAAGAEQMYQALRSVGVPAQLVIYPGQFHGVTVPSYQADRLQRYLDWFGKYLK